MRNRIYLLLIGLLILSGCTAFSERLIKDKYGYPFGIAVADIDGDGDNDLTSSDADKRCIYWLENDGMENFKSYYVKEKHEVSFLERHVVGDINNDGHPDVVIVDNLNGNILWYENNGKPGDKIVWKQHYITIGGMPGAYDVAIGDLDKDGDVDIAATGWRSNTVAWFENCAKGDKEGWARHSIDDDLKTSRCIRIVDFDKDGNMDILAGGQESALVAWYKNPGDTNKNKWERIVIDEFTFYPNGGQAIDIDNDGDLDVVMAGSEKPGSNTGNVVWYENNGNPEKGLWSKHKIYSSLEGCFEASAGDLDNDGDIDVAVTAWGDDGWIAWFENCGNPKKKWKKHVLKNNWKKANQVIVRDLNKDGALDLLAIAERGSAEFRWWKNMKKGKK
ncbi:MAG: VCBS repeat-containing protein [Endomicrobiales bacterium]|nr:VCBS repeat-containing protein [Endomicrobiales bacterium]